ncbi:Hypothetical protein A7982_00379 [Minicystis rosea]|nr:Hypothetical protein A7982_00379 [Minicystis rosea]
MKDMLWSDEARILVRPFRAYADLAAAGDERPARTAALRILFFLFICGAFVSLFTAGRLVAFHVVSTMAFWSFIPAAQALVFLGVLEIVNRRSSAPPATDEPTSDRDPPSSYTRRRARAGGASRAEALALYFAGHGPWMLFFMLLAGICLVAPDVYRTMVWLLRHGVLPALFLTTIVWSAVLTYACFRRGLAFPRARAGAATALFYVGFSTLIIGYYLAMNEIQPQLPWAP